MAISDSLQESKLSRLGLWLSSFRGDLTGGLTAAVVALLLFSCCAAATALVTTSETDVDCYYY